MKTIDNLHFPYNILFRNLWQSSESRTMAITYGNCKYPFLEQDTFYDFLITDMLKICLINNWKYNSVDRGNYDYINVRVPSADPIISPEAIQLSYQLSKRLKARNISGW